MEALMEVEVPLKFDQVKRNREEIILALRSGRYTQIIGVQSNDYENHHCIYGLRIKLFGPRSDYSSKDDNTLHLSMKEWIVLANLNNSGKTFLELSDILVKNYNFPDVR